MILKTKYFNIETDLFSFREPESIRKRIENRFKNCFTDKPSTHLEYTSGSVKISFNYEPTKAYFSTPFPIDPEDLIFLNIGCMEGYKIMDEDYTCRGFHYEHNHSYSIDENPIPCEKGFHFCRELTNCFYYYRPTASIEQASTEYIEQIRNVTYDLDVFKFFNVKSNGTTYQLADKCCTNNITILEECSTEEILEAFKEWINGEWLDINNFKVKLRGGLYLFHDGIYHKIIIDGGLNNLQTLYTHSKEN